MNNAEKILGALDERLTAVVELTLYGRAALQLGFENTPEDYAWSRDIDAVLWLGQAEELADKTNFWDAVEGVNQLFAEEGLYISHFFEEDQVVLGPDWREHRVRLTGDWRHILLYRLGDTDLFLSKLMRDDPIDQQDARFIVEQVELTRAAIRKAIQSARVPPIPEIQEQFAICAGRFLDT